MPVIPFTCSMKYRINLCLFYRINLCLLNAIEKGVKSFEQKGRCAQKYMADRMKTATNMYRMVSGSPILKKSLNE